MSRAIASSRRASVTFLARLAIGIGATVVSGSARSSTEDLAVVFVLDESGSIASSDFQIQVNGFASAVEDTAILPQDGSMAVGALTFDTSSRRLFEVTQLTRSSSPTLAAGLRSATHHGGGTDLAEAVTLAASMFAQSTASRKVMIVSTDGQPDSASAARVAADSAITSGVTEVHAIGVGSVSTTFLNSFVRPLPDSGVTGKVLMADTFEELAEHVRTLLGIVIADDEHVVNRLSLNGPNAQVQLRQPTPLTITAVNSSGRRVRTFRGVATLQASSGIPVQPMTVPLADGQWAGQLTFGAEGVDVVLVASAAGHAGESSPFDIGAAISGTISVFTRSACDGLLMAVSRSGVPVTLTRNGVDVVLRTSDAHGVARFESIAPGRYRVSAPGFVGAEVHHGTAPTTSVSICPGSAGPPVIIVPGIMGSEARPGYFYPELPGAACPAPREQLEAVAILTGYPDLEERLRAGATVIAAPWDWRCGIATAVHHYLIPAIDEAKRATGSDSVALVAHSMGGLLARYYLESDEFEDRRGDVNALIMLGTPNNGATVPYYMVEGGDALAADVIQGGLNYSKIVEPVFERQLIYTSRVGTRHMFRPRGLGFCDTRCTDCAHCYRDGIITTDEDAIDFYEEIVPSVRDLLATYPMLKSDVGLEVVHTNDVLLKLNAAFDPSLYSAAAEMGRVRTLIIASSQFPTLDQIEVTDSPPGASSYLSGWPLSGADHVVSDVGDGTVPCHSVLGPFVPDGSCASLPDPADMGVEVVVDENGGKHVSMMGRHAARVATFLGIPARAGEVSVAGTAADQHGLRIDVEGLVRVQVSLPSGVLGVDSLGLSHEVTAEGSFEQAGERAHFHLTNMPTGEHVLSVASTIGLQSVNARLLSVTSQQFDQSEVLIAQDAALELLVTVDADGNAALAAPCPAARDLAARDDGGLARISWFAISGDSLQHDLYGRRYGEAGWNLLGTTAQSTLLTGVPWTGDPWEVLVVTRCSTGSSFASQSIVTGARPPLIQLSAVPTRGRAPLDVTFTVNADVSDVAWHLDAEGGVDAVGGAVMHRYLVPGLYSVAIEGTIDGRRVALNRANLIEVVANTPPVAAAGADVSTACTSSGGAIVSLDGTASGDPDGDAISFLWDADGIAFDDPSSSAPSASFPSGTTMVQLVVSDGQETHADSVLVTVGECCLTGDIYPPGGDGQVTLADVISGFRAVRARAPLAEESLACGDVHPGAVTCRRLFGLAGNWCATPDGEFRIGDAVVLARLFLELLDESCTACEAEVASAEETRVPGDVAGSEGHGDSVVNVADVVRTLRWSVGLEEPGESLLMADIAPAELVDGRYDVRGDGRIDVADVVLLLRASVGMAELRWPERELRIGFEGPRPAAWSCVVGGVPAWAIIADPSESADCGDALVAHVGVEGGWSVVCDAGVSGDHEPEVHLRYRAPEPIRADLLAFRASAVGGLLGPLPITPIVR